MTYRAHIRNGVAVLDEPAHLLEGTPVRLEVDRIDADFWDGKSIAQLVQEQGVSVCRDPAALAGEWPEDESLDEFLAFTREARR